MIEYWKCYICVVTDYDNLEPQTSSTSFFYAVFNKQTLNLMAIWWRFYALLIWRLILFEAVALPTYSPILESRVDSIWTKHKTVPHRVFKVLRSLNWVISRLNSNRIVDSSNEFIQQLLINKLEFVEVTSIIVLQLKDPKELPLHLMDFHQNGSRKITRQD